MPEEKKSIKNGWQSYRKTVLQNIPDNPVVEEVRHGFYAGAVFLYLLMMNLAKAELEPVAMSIADEIKNYMDCTLDEAPKG